MSLLELKNLFVCLRNNENKIILNNISFSLEKGESLSIIGESGSGKTTIARSILKLVDKNLLFKSGCILFNGKDILSLTESQMTKIRGDSICFLPQESLNYLNPLIKCGDQISEVLIIKKKKNKIEAFDEVIFFLSLCGFDDPEEIYNKYPFELSGGSRQKVLFAISNIIKPRLLIADEPTSSLDLVSEKEILNLLIKFKSEYKQSLIFITHNIMIAKRISQKVVILRNGIIEEYGLTSDVFENPKSEYTKELIKNASYQI